MVNPDNVMVIPVPGVIPDLDLLDDCKLVTQLMRKAMFRTPSLSAADAFALVRRRVTMICVLKWDQMEPVEICPNPGQPQ